MKALIVEPSATYRKILTHLFEQKGFSVEITGTGAIALQRHLLDSFDLTCVAMHLEDMTGTQFCATLRKQSAARNHPIIMLTADENGAEIGARLQAGITEVFRKSKLPELGEYLTNFAKRDEGGQRLNARVLLVEDDPQQADVFRAVLEGQGLQVDQFARAEDARAAFFAGDYDLVLADILLAGPMSGLALVRAIRGLQDRKARVPILVLSALDDAARRLEVLREGASDYVAKPLMAEELIARARNLVISKQLLDTVEGQRERMQELAMTDQLTGLYNRHYMSDIVPKALSEAVRHGFAVSLIVADVDHFKSINDGHGHAVGDIVLREVAKLLKSECRKGDFAGRFGGEEFLLLLQHCDAESAVNWAEQVREKLENLKPNGLRVTASFGVSSSHGHAHISFDQLFAAADRAVYEAKGGGRNRVVSGQLD
jgi:two-component system cell cycle response regulator